MQKKSHLLSIDLESWVFSRRIDKLQLTISQLRRLDNGYSKEALAYLLKQLKKYDQHITFFIVGRLEEMYPGTIEKIAKNGHEVGWHTHSHANITDISILTKELEASKKIINEYRLKGFQAPTITFIKEGYSILKKYGFTYSSSIYGNSADIYDFNGVLEIPVSSTNSTYHPKKGDIVFPSNMTIGNMKKFGLPYGSSFFWGIFGERYYTRQLRKAESNNTFSNLFIHEWQLIKPTSTEYKKDINLFTNPLFFPYTLSVREMFESLLAKHRFQTFKQYIKTIKQK